MSTRDAKSWILIRDELLRRVRERVWEPGALIPGEVELAEEFGCARTTVNRALRDLADAGLVHRRRRAGTRVAVNPPHKATLTIPIIREEVEARGGTYHHALQQRGTRPLPAHLGGVFPLPDGAEVLHTVTLHYEDGRPYIHEERYINLANAPDLADQDFARISANEWLVQNAPYTGGDMSFFALPADAALADAFDTSLGTALFAAERSTWNDQGPITLVRMTYAPGFRMRTSI
ncbi:UTRA domain-containing protein [Pseudooceanicola algae]|uniref:Uncharacterized protein n=1 Tax=Pseudooceanicola algae TaxID=1537215 RepID=A0A418SGA6_9RHOB|nr:UTRA domain-containing protein [Pseudooceanicola algae]QPM91659.1 hypothetical protein PSAL_029140 [Pseudooceanicola algae]